MAVGFPMHGPNHATIPPMHRAQTAIEKNNVAPNHLKKNLRHASQTASNVTRRTAATQMTLALRGWFSTK